MAFRATWLCFCLLACSSGRPQSQPAINEHSNTAAKPLPISDAPPPDAPVSKRLSCSPESKAVASMQFVLGGFNSQWSCLDARGKRNGPSIALFPTGATAVTANYLDDVFHGEWVRYDEAGQVRESGHYHHGKKDGEWKHFGRAGEVLGSYVMERGTGTEKQWHESGVLAAERELLDGVASGSAKQYSATGSLLISENYKDGLREGHRFAGDKALLRVDETYSNGVRKGEHTLWRRGWKLALQTFDRSGRRHGKFTFWRDRKTMRDTGQYSHGKREGEWQWFDGDNNLEGIGNYLDGKRNGQWRELYAKRTTFSGEYRDGKPDGTFTYLDYRGRTIGSFEITAGTGKMFTYYSNKKVETETDFKNGKQDGKYRVFTTQNKVVLEANYRNGKRHGAWVEKTSAGTVVLQCEYEADKLVGSYKKFRDGKLMIVANYGRGSQAGVRSGEYNEFRGDAPSLRGHYENDKRHGAWTTFASDGSVQSVATYSAGVLDGDYSEFVAGKPAIIGTYANGVRTGTWKWLDGNGNVLREVNHISP